MESLKYCSNKGQQIQFNEIVFLQKLFRQHFGQIQSFSVINGESFLYSFSNK